MSFKIDFFVWLFYALIKLNILSMEIFDILIGYLVQAYNADRVWFYVICAFLAFFVVLLLRIFYSFVRVVASLIETRLLKLKK